MWLGVWVNTKQNLTLGSREKVVYSGHEAAPLFTLASLGDETDRGNNLRVNKAPFLLLTSPLWAALPAVQQSVVQQFTNLPNLALSSCESSFSAIVLNWGCFHPEYLILFISYTYVLGTFVHFYFRPLPLPLYFGVPLPLPIPGTFVPPYSQGASLVYPNLDVSIL